MPRVSAVQFAVTQDVTANLATCLRMIDEAARHKPDLVVLPEFINHSAWYENAEHCYRVAVALDGDFLKTIAAKAAEHHFYIKVNCTVQRAGGKVTGTNLLFDPRGQRVAVNDKQILMGNENNFLERATEAGPVVDTPIGKLGMYCCMDGVIPEPARGLAVRGAQILLNSLNSFAHDEASLHIPVRASENKVFVVAANKVGPLVPLALTQMIAERMKIAPHFLNGAGESQIVAPDGAVLAQAPPMGEAVVFADIVVAQADDKRRPDDTDIMATRRPGLYQPIAHAPRPRQIRPGATRVEAAVYQPRADGPEAIEEVAKAIADAARAGVQLIVLPELVYMPAGVVTDPARAVAESRQWVTTVRAALHASECYVATTLVAGADGQYQHVGVLIGRDGVVLRQPQLHRAGRHAPWLTVLGEALQVLDLPWGRVALVVGGDAIYPEVFRLAALRDVEVVAVPTRILESWELHTGLRERSSENRMNLVVASRASEVGASAIIALDKDFTLWAKWERPFDGNISLPIITRATPQPGLTRAPIFPACAENRMISQKTNVVEGRPWQLVDGLVSCA